MQRRLSGDAYLEQIATTKDVIFRDFRSVCTCSFTHEAGSPLQRRSSLQYAQHTTLPTAAAVASRNSSTQFASISAWTKSTCEESRQAPGGPQPRFKLSASSLFPLNGQEPDRPGLFIAASRPYRGSARAKRVLIGSKNDCSVASLAVHGLRKKVFSSSSICFIVSKIRPLGSLNRTPTEAGKHPAKCSSS